MQHYINKHRTASNVVCGALLLLTFTVDLPGVWS